MDDLIYFCFKGKPKQAEDEDYVPPKKVTLNVPVEVHQEKEPEAQPVKKDKGPYIPSKEESEYMYLNKLIKYLDLCAWLHWLYF